MIRTPRGCQMLVVGGNGAADLGSSLPSLWPAVIPIAGAQEGGGQCNRLERGWCQWALVLELCSTEICDKAVMDFLVATDVGMIPPGCRMQASVSCLFGYTTLECRTLLLYSFVSRDERW